MNAVTLVWHRIVAAQPAASDIVVVGAAALAAVLVAVRPTWEVTRHVITLVHEGAHGFVAMLSGRRLAGIRLHSDSSGVTVTSGRPTGLGMIATTGSGYIGPAMLGLVCALLLAQGHAVAVLWLLLVCLALLLVQIRNFFGFASVVATGVVLFFVSWRLDLSAQVAVAYVVTWFLLIAAPRPVWELQASRRAGRARGSDADQLGRLTGLPALLWVAVFFVVTVGALVVGAGLLVR